MGDGGQDGDSEFVDPCKSSPTMARVITAVSLA